MVTNDLAEVWKSAVTVAFETPVKFPRTEPEMPHQIPVAPPLYPIPTPLATVTPPMHTGSPSTYCPYLLHNGPNFDSCLAKQYVCFEPLESYYQNNDMDSIPDVNNINDIVSITCIRLIIIIIIDFQIQDDLYIGYSQSII